MADDHKTTPKGADTPGTKPDDKANPENTQDKMGKRLDDALEETFPSSDPVSVKITK
ncbi:hypothetical protein [Methylobacterium trifolii]|uniref:Uncharacterized protein n=1 Tax=Methylobacterium trifolii TaxID=1003092 RepID=A0ABQ4TZQ9_9HYPH|nr:hypothetical protein [Methylobacterium trifolii]GJE60745.1 hypothetical protein MPOCJGCO_2861 [Methylobacterium trifolii]